MSFNSDDQLRLMDKPLEKKYGTLFLYDSCSKNFVSSEMERHTESHTERMDGEDNETD